jgi:hypothetical protein
VALAQGFDPGASSPSWRPAGTAATWPRPGGEKGVSGSVTHTVTREADSGAGKMLEVLNFTWLFAIVAGIFFTRLSD